MVRCLFLAGMGGGPGFCGMPLFFILFLGGASLLCFVLFVSSDIYA